MKLQRFEKDNLELLINLDNGEVFSSQNALVRMCEKPETTIRNFARAHSFGENSFEIPTAQGLQRARIYTEDEIYKTLEKFNPSLLINCAKAGLRLYLHGLAGFKYELKKQEDTQFKQEVLASLALLHNKIDAQQQEILYLKPIAEQYEKVSKSFDLLVDLQPLLEKIADELKTNPNQEYKPLSKWLKELGFPTVSRGKNIALGKLLTSFMKVGTLNNYLKPKGNSKYPEAFVPLIKESYFFTLRN